MPKVKASSTKGPQKTQKPPLEMSAKIATAYMMAATMPIIIVSIMNATRRMSQWFISICELLCVDIF